jgi:hypothetical protein
MSLISPIYLGYTDETYSWIAAWKIVINRLDVVKYHCVEVADLSAEAWMCRFPWCLDEVCIFCKRNLEKLEINFETAEHDEGEAEGEIDENETERL